MSNMTDILEEYIKKLFLESNDNFIVIKRSNVAQKFDCVPSQLNYVIKTRFTPEHGFMIESKRGGGGFIRITKITFRNKDYIDYLIENIDTKDFQIEDIYNVLKILKTEKVIDTLQYNGIIDCLNSLIDLRDYTLQLVTDSEKKNKIEEQTRLNIKDLAINFLNNIKYKTRG